MKLTDENEDDDDDNMVKPISYEIHKPTEPVKKNRIGFQPKVSSERKLGPTVPDHIKETLEKSPEDETGDGKPKKEESTVQSTDQTEFGQEQEDVSEESGDVSKKKRGDR